MADCLKYRAGLEWIAKIDPKLCSEQHSPGQQEAAFGFRHRLGGPAGAQVELRGERVPSVGSLDEALSTQPSSPHTTALARALRRMSGTAAEGGDTNTSAYSASGRQRGTCHTMVLTFGALAHTALRKGSEGKLMEASTARCSRRRLWAERTGRGPDYRRPLGEESSEGADVR